MADAKHVAGPWEIDAEREAGSGENYTIVASGAPIADVLGTSNFSCLEEDEHDRHDAEIQATARLIAAAPDLYAVNDEAIAFYEGTIHALSDGVGNERKDLNLNQREALRIAREKLVRAKAARAKARGAP